MSSDSERSSAGPSDAVLKAALQKVVLSAHDTGSLERLSVNSVRTEAEQALGLDPGFFKDHATWRSRSKEVINEAVENPGSIPKPKPSSAGQKRKGKSDDKPLKRQKKVAKEESPTAEEDSEDQVKARAATSRHSSSSKLSDAADVSDADGEAAGGGADSDSSLSDVKDEVPRKQKKKAERSTSTAGKSTKANSNKVSKDDSLSPDEQEIKRLQGWLVKCGIRKLWHRELAGCDSNKAKIKHLKTMLEDAGMTGRYSAEKASAIKEQRELAADLEAVQEGNKQWGKTSSESGGSDSDGKPRRRKGVASRFVDFGSDEDDE